MSSLGKPSPQPLTSPGAADTPALLHPPAWKAHMSSVRLLSSSLTEGTHSDTAGRGGQLQSLRSVGRREEEGGSGGRLPGGHRLPLELCEGPVAAPHHT